MSPPGAGAALHPPRPADLAGVRDLRPNEEARKFDLADMEAVVAACEGVDAIVHFGGVALGPPWGDVLDSNIRGSYRLRRRRPETSRQARDPCQFCPRRQLSPSGRPNRHQRAASPRRTLRPVEMLRRRPRPALLGQVRDRKRRAAHFSSLFRAGGPADSLVLAFVRGLQPPDCRCPDRAAGRFHRVLRHLGQGRQARRQPAGRASVYVPQDDTEPFRAAIEAKLPAPDPGAPAVQDLGGWFAGLGHLDDEATR